MFCKIIVTVFKNDKNLLFFLLSFQSRRFIALDLEAPVFQDKQLVHLNKTEHFGRVNRLQVNQVYDNIILELDQHQHK